MSTDSLETLSRDTSWVQGELANAIEAFPHTVRRFGLAGRYHLVEEDDFKDLLADDLSDHRGYWRGKFDVEDFTPAFVTRFWHRHGTNGVGLVVDFESEDLYCVAVYQQGGVEFFDANAQVFVEPVEYEPERGVILL